MLIVEVRFFLISFKVIIKKGLNKSSPFYVLLDNNYLAGGTYSNPPLVQIWFGPLSGKIPVSAIFLL